MSNIKPKVKEIWIEKDTNRKVIVTNIDIIFSDIYYKFINSKYNKGYNHGLSEENFLIYFKKSW